MATGHYYGGSTLLGFGSVSSGSKGRRGGVGTSGAALREQRKAVEKKRKKILAAKIKVNEKIVKQIGQRCAAEKGRTQYENLVADHRIKTSPLAAALRQAMMPVADDDV